MRKKDWGDYKNQCRMCGELGHNIRTCPVVPILAERGITKIATHSSLPVTWREKKCMMEMEKRKKIKQKREREKHKQKAKRKCSFCGGKEHNRKNCEKIATTRELLQSANNIWRKKFIEKCNTAGFGRGCLIILGEIQLYSPPETSQIQRTSVLLDIPWDKLGFMCMYRANWEYQTNITFPIMMAHDDSRSYAIGEGDVVKLIDAEQLIGKPAHGFKLAGYSNLKLMSKTTPTPPDGWLESKNDNNIEWLLQRHSYAKLKNLSIIQLAKNIIGGE